MLADFNFIQNKSGYLETGTISLMLMLKLGLDFCTGGGIRLLRIDSFKYHSNLDWFKEDCPNS